MPSIGPMEMVVILVIALVVFGPKFRSSVSGSTDKELRS